MLRGFYALSVGLTLFCSTGSFGEWKRLDRDITSINGDRVIEGADYYETYFDGVKSRARYGKLRNDGFIEVLRKEKVVREETSSNPSFLDRSEGRREPSGYDFGGNSNRQRESTPPRQEGFDSKKGRFLSYREAFDLAFEDEKNPKPMLIFITSERCSSCAAWEGWFASRDIKALTKDFYMAKINYYSDRATADVVYNFAKKKGWIREAEREPPTLIILDGEDSRIELGLPEKDNLEHFLKNEVLTRGWGTYLGNYKRNYGTKLGESGRTREAQRVEEAPAPRQEERRVEPEIGDEYPFRSRNGERQQNDRNPFKNRSEENPFKEKRSEFQPRDGGTDSRSGENRRREEGRERDERRSDRDLN